MRVALIHDYLVQYGGAERVLEIFTEMYPDADIYTLIHDESKLYGGFRDKKIHTSFIQKLPFAKTNHRLFPLLMPSAIESFDLSKYDLILSSTNSYSKGVITSPDSIHISYCHTPMRYTCDDCHRYFKEFKYSRLIKFLLPFAITYIRMWDKISSDRPDYYIANSYNVQRRISKYYRLESKVIYPPVLTDKFKVLDNPKNNFYLMLGRFLPYKHYDIVIQAFVKNKKRLIIVGSGPEEEKLIALAKNCKNIEFKGRLDDDKARDLFMNCKAFIFPSEDDFGIVPVEAMSAGRPVIAFGKGGALETMIDGKTGVLFYKQTRKSFQIALDKFEKMKFDSSFIRKHSEKFSVERFKRELKEFIDEKVGEKNNII